MPSMGVGRGLGSSDESHGASPSLPEGNWAVDGVKVLQWWEGVGVGATLRGLLML